ncbi:vacuolar import and degradation protein-domain-containing protein [Boletus coccyginus]|nr:vacuolar import and degradation protein-domain-containing protein [Boletus coccyginus]
MDVQQSLPLSPPSSVAPPQPSLAAHTTAACPKSTPTQQRSSPDAGARGRPQRPSVPMPVPDPATDITRLRVCAKRHHCLYPAVGTSYDVNVTIVDVDFSSSFLCGYLRIRGLTDDWPELTTYFDAEIIGNRYGFLTQKWGANEQEDMVHWQRFPAFRHVKNELRRPHLTMPDRDRGAVFMRWKERFLVPDHRIQDISGASFAGFYYVCVDFNPQSPGSNIRSATQSFPLCVEECGEGDLLTSPSPGKLESIPVGRRRRDSSVLRGGRGSSIGPRSPPPAATMCGFYFHQNSEPYQQLSLSHVPERSSSCFEFR